MLKQNWTVCTNSILTFTNSDDMNNEETLIEFLKNNHGYISLSELLKLKIYKP